jgi:hypothetical protein
MIGFISSWVTHSLLIILTHRQYSSIAHLRTFQFTVAHALRFSVFTSRLLATDLNTQTITVSLDYTLQVLHIKFFSQRLSSQLTPRTNLNCGILSAAIILSHPTDNCSHKSSIHTFRSSSITNLPRLPPAENSLTTDCNLLPRTNRKRT